MWGRCRVPTREVSRSGWGQAAGRGAIGGERVGQLEGRCPAGIQGKGFYLNDEPIEATDLQLDETQLQGPGA